MDIFRNISFLNSTSFVLGALIIMLGVYREMLNKKEDGSEKSGLITLTWIALGILTIIVGQTKENLYREEDDKQQKKMIAMQSDLLSSQKKIENLQDKLTLSQAEMLKLQRDVEVKMREGAIRVLAAEIMVNLDFFENPFFSESDDEKLSKFVMYPRFQTVGLSRALTSGLFQSEKDRELFTRISNLHQVLTEINSRLQFSEDFMSRDKNQILSFRKSIKNSPAIISAKAKIIDLAKLLIKEYGISEKDSFFVKLK